MKKDKRESALRIMEALSGVDEELLERCGQPEPMDVCNGKKVSGEKKIYGFMGRYGGLCAACLCLAVLGAAYFGIEQQQKGTSMDTAESAQAENMTESMLTEEETEAVWKIPGSQAEEGESAEKPESAAGEETGMTELSSQNSSSQDSMTDRVHPEEEIEMMQEEVYKQSENMAGEEISWEDACAVEGLGKYVPDRVPDGYQLLSAIYYDMGTDGGSSILLSWTDGEHSFLIKLTEAETGNKMDAAEKPVIIAGENRECEIPKPGEDGITRFAILYEDGVLAEYEGCLAESEIKGMFESVNP